MDHLKIVLSVSVSMAIIYQGKSMSKKSSSTRLVRLANVNFSSFLGNFKASLTFLKNQNALVFLPIYFLEMCFSINVTMTKSFGAD